MTTQTLLANWLNTYAKEHIKVRTYLRYQSIIASHIKPTLGERNIEDVTRGDIQSFLACKKAASNLRFNGRKLSATSINLIFTVLNLAFNYACDMELIEKNPCGGIRRVHTTTKRAEAFTKEEQRKIEMTIMASGDLRLFGIILCLYTGLRLGELLGLEWSDIDTSGGLIYVNKTIYRSKDGSGVWKLFVDKPKTAASDRIIPMPAYITEMVIAQRKMSKSPYVVANKKDGRMSIRSYQYMFEKLTEKAGVRKLNFHALRHTFATRAIECGMDIKTLAEIMGHQNASITLNRYAHCMMDHKIAMMNRLPKNF
ncbi:MAG: site-specific integrase [Spirochaetaceae bacterium]|nr:site-specific integrase [Spirochaetaceae bacterium]